MNLDELKITIKCPECETEITAVIDIHAMKFEPMKRVD